MQVERMKVAPDTVGYADGAQDKLIVLLPNLATSEDEEQQHEIGFLSHANIYAGTLVGGPLLNMLTAGEATQSANSVGIPPRPDGRAATGARRLGRPQ